MNVVDPELRTSTVGDLLDVLNDMVESGRRAPSTIIPLRIAVGKVMRETEPESINWKKIPLGELDLENRMVFFRNTVTSCSRETADIYKTRFERAISLYETEVHRSRLQRRFLESSSRRPEHVYFNTMADPEKLDYTVTAPLFDKTGVNKKLGNIQTVQDEYVLHIKKELKKLLATTDFEKTNTVFPIDLTGDDAFLIIPKDISQERKELLQKKINLLLDYND